MDDVSYVYIQYQGFRQKLRDDTVLVPATPIPPPYPSPSHPLYNVYNDTIANRFYIYYEAIHIMYSLM